MTARLASHLFYGAVGIFFGVAAVVKLADPEAFFSSLLTYQLFPREVALGLALFAPWLEALAAIGLVTGLWRRGAALLAGAMLVLFIVLVAQGLARGLELDCGCFGSNRLETGMDYALKIGENLALLAALLVGGYFRRQAERPAQAEVED